MLVGVKLIYRKSFHDKVISISRNGKEEFLSSVIYSLEIIKISQLGYFYFHIKLI